MIRKSRIIFVLIIFFVILLSLPLSISQSIKIKIVDFLSPLIRGSNYLVCKIFSVKDYFGAVSENRSLHKKLDELNGELNKLEEIEKENQRLRQLLDLKKQISYETITCRVIARDSGTWYKSLIIDKGEESGVCADMPVLGANGGIIGRVADTGKNASSVLLITDANSSIGGIIQNTRTIGLVEGDDIDGCFLNLIPRNAEIEQGGVVVTSGLSEIFPKGLMIGTITDIKEGRQGLCKIAKVKLFADIDRVEEVLVMKNQTTR